MSNASATPHIVDHTETRPWAESSPRAKPLGRISPSLFPAALIAADFGLTGLWCFFMLRGADPSRPGHFSLELVIALDTALLVVALLKINQFYKIERLIKPQATFDQLGVIWAVVFLSLFIMWVLVRSPHAAEFPWFALWCIGGFIVLSTVRMSVGHAYRACVEKGLLCRAVVLFGTADRTAPLHEYLASSQHGIKVVAVHNMQAGSSADGLERTSEIQDFMRFQQPHEIDTIILAMPLEDAMDIQNILLKHATQAAKVRLFHNGMGFAPPRCGYVADGEIPGLNLAVISDHPISFWGMLAKNALDRMVAFAALLFFGPLMLICAAGIKLSSPGPVLFRQRRIGYRNQIFNVYKFRSMHCSAVVNHDLTARNDPRIFAFGHVLRKLSFDELPQLFNVLKGDMSLVGPRPHMPEARAAGKFYYDVVTEYAQRHHVRPGITGWAQVNGWRGPTETTEQIEQRVKHDLYYIDNWSLTLDFKILFKTLFVGFFGKNAF